jgi:hypothetical protein
MPTYIRTFNQLDEKAKQKAKEFAAANNKKVEDLILVLDTVKKGSQETPSAINFEEAPGKIGATVRRVATGVIPSVAAVGAGAAAAPSGVGAFVAGAGAGAGVGYAQDWALRKIAPSATRQLDIDRQYYPKLTTAADAAGILTGQRQMLLNKGVLSVLRSGGAREAGREAFRQVGGGKGLGLNLAIGGGAGAGIEGVQQFREGDFDLGRLTTAIAANAVMGGGAPRSASLAIGNKLRKVIGRPQIDAQYRPITSQETSDVTGEAAKDWIASRMEAAKIADQTPDLVSTLVKDYNTKFPDRPLTEDTLRTLSESVKNKRLQEEEAVKKTQEEAKKELEAEQKKADNEAKRINKLREEASEKIKLEKAVAEFDPTQVKPKEKDTRQLILKHFKGSVTPVGTPVDNTFLDLLAKHNPEGYARFEKIAADAEAKAQAEKATSKTTKPAKTEQPKVTAEDLANRRKEIEAATDKSTEEREASLAEVTKAEQVLTEQSNNELAQAMVQQEDYIAGKKNKITPLLESNLTKLPQKFKLTSAEEPVFTAKTKSYLDWLSKRTGISSDDIEAGAVTGHDRASRLSNNLNDYIIEYRKALDVSASRIKRRPESTTSTGDIENIAAQANASESGSKVPIRGGNEERISIGPESNPPPIPSEPLPVTETLIVSNKGKVVPKPKRSVKIRGKVIPIVGEVPKPTVDSAVQAAEDAIKAMADRPNFEQEIADMPGVSAERKIEMIEKVKAYKASSPVKQESIERPPREAGNLYSNPFGVYAKSLAKLAGKAADWTIKNTWSRKMAGSLQRAREGPDWRKAEYLGNKAKDTEIEHTKLSNQFEKTIDDGIKGLDLTQAEKDRVRDWVDYRDIYGIDPYTLSPKEQQLADAFRLSADETLGEQLTNGPLINNQRQKKGYDKWAMDAIMDKDVRETLLKYKPGWENLRDDYVNWYLSHTPNGTVDDAIGQLDVLLGKTNRKTSTEGPTAQTLRKAMGVGLPVSMREKDLVARMRWNAHLTAADLAWHRNIESDPTAAVMLGVTDNAKGVDYDTNVSEYSDPATQAKYLLPDMGDGVKELAKNSLSLDWVKDLKAEMDLPRRANSTSLEKWTSLVNAMTLGPKSAVRDMFNTGAIMMGTLHGKEYFKPLQAMGRMLGKSKNSPYEKGIVKRKDTADFINTEAIAREGVVAANDTIRKAQGRDMAERGIRSLIAHTGDMIHTDRLQSAIAGNKEDIRFMDEFAGKDWRNNIFDPDSLDKMLDRMDRRFVEHFQGSYGPEYLPHHLLRSADEQFLKTTFTLSRWAIERANRFHQEVIKPMAKDGDIKPFLKHAFGFTLGSAAMDYVFETIMDMKPREMTWPEFFGLATKDGGKYDETKGEELAYTILSKAAMMGFGGMFSQILDSANKIRHGESIFAYANPAMRMAGDTLHKVVNYLGTYGAEGLVDPSKLWQLPYEVMMDEVQGLKMIRQGLSNKEESGSREERILKRLRGETKWGLRVSEDPDPFSPVRKLKGAESVEDIKGLEEPLTDYYRRNNQSAPSRIEMPLRKRAEEGYYDLIDILQGPSKKGERIAYDINQNRLAGMRKAVAKRAWLKAEMANR